MSKKPHSSQTDTTSQTFANITIYLFEIGTDRRVPTDNTHFTCRFVNIGWTLARMDSAKFFVVEEL